jgi:hypothetical protein
MKSRAWKKKRTFVVNWKASSETEKRLKNFWGVSIFNPQNLLAFQSDFKSEIGRLARALQPGGA